MNSEKRKAKAESPTWKAGEMGQWERRVNGSECSQSPAGTDLGFASRQWAIERATHPRGRNKEVSSRRKGRARGDEMVLIHGIAFFQELQIVPVDSHALRCRRHHRRIMGGFRGVPSH